MREKLSFQETGWPHLLRGDKIVCFSSNTAFGCGFQGYSRISEDVMLKSPLPLLPSGFSKLKYSLWIQWSICDVNGHHSNAKQVKYLTVRNAKRPHDIMKVLISTQSGQVHFQQLRKSNYQTWGKTVIFSAYTVGLCKLQITWSFTILTVTVHLTRMKK